MRILKRKTLIALSLLTIASLAHQNFGTLTANSAEISTVLYTPQLLNVEMNISDQKIESGFKTVVSMKVKIRVLDDPITGMQFTLRPTYISEGLPAPEPDVNCQWQVNINSSPGHLGKSSGLVASTEKTQDGLFTIQTFNFKNIFEQNLNTDKGVIEPVNLCSGNYEIRRVGIDTALNHGSVISRVYWQKQPQDWLVVPFWDSSTQAPPCTFNSNQKLSIDNVIYKVYNQCIHSIDFGTSRFMYDKKKSQEQALKYEDERAELRKLLSGIGVQIESLSKRSKDAALEVARKVFNLINTDLAAADPSEFSDKRRIATSLQADLLALERKYPIPVSAPKMTISCVKGKVIKKVTGVKPVCPSGFKKK